MDFRPLSVLVGAAFFMEQLDATILAPAIPTIAATFGVTPLSLDLAMTLYLLCGVILIPIAGHVSDRFGPRQAFQAAVTLFAASSVLCGLAGGPVGLAVARCLQGASTAFMVPVGRMAIVRSVDRSQLVCALAWMVTPAMLGPLLGPPLGGLIAAYADWRWIFFINIPVGIVAFHAASKYFPELPQRVPPRIDILEWLLLAIALGSAVAALNTARHPGLPDTLRLAPWLTFVISTMLYRRRLRVSVAPLLDFRLLRLPTFRAAFWAGALIRVGYGAVPFVLPLMLQTGLHLDSVSSGAILLLSGAVALLTKTRTTAILKRYGFRRVLLWNGSLAALALASCALFNAEWAPWTIAVVVCVGGFVRSIQYNALAAIAYADTAPEQIGAATALNTSIQQIAILTGVSFSVAVTELSGWFGSRTTPAAADFSIAFVCLGVACLAAIPFCFGLASSAGQEISGHASARA